MRWLRHKWFVALFFTLISLGQAYPYSYAWALGRQEECGCNLSGRKCIHGCDLKRKREGGHAPAHGRALEVLVTGEDGPVWVNPDCSRQQRRQVLSFRTEPFLPQQLLVIFQPSWLGYAWNDCFVLVDVPAVLDPPPPKA